MPVALSLSKRAADPYTSSVMSHVTLSRRPRVRDRSPDSIPRSTGIGTTANDPEQGSMVVKNRRPDLHENGPCSCPIPSQSLPLSMMIYRRVMARDSCLTFAPMACERHPAE
jgi:hypothetical protein